MQTVPGRAVAVLATVTCCLALAFCAGRTSETGKAEGSAPAATPASAEASPAPAPETKGESPDADEPSLQPQAAAGAVQGVPAPTNTAPIIAVANYFTDLPGIDVASLKPRQKERFLQRVNSEMCTCGCKNDTLAHCYVNDQRCPVVKGIVQRVFEEARSAK